MNELTLFERLGIPGFTDETSEPWFLLREICRASEMENNPHLKDRIDPKDMLSKQTLTSGGMQDMIYVNERGFYAAIGGSRKEKARHLVQSLLSEIPKIRQLANQRIANLEVQITRGGGHLLLKAVPEISNRSRLNMIVRRFVARQVSGYGYEDAWRELYYQFKYRYDRADLKARARIRKADPLDCATPAELENMVALAALIFRPSE